MTERNLYSAFEQSKTGEKVAVYYNGHWSFSKYNPSRDVELLLSKITNKKQTLVIGGIGSAIHIEKALQKSNISLIIAVEENTKSLDFCKNETKIKSDKLIFCTIKELNNTLKQNYNPILHGDLTFLPVQSWLDNIEDSSQVYDIFTNTVKEISADISTQAFFGKIWHSNILNNLQTIEKVQNSKLLAKKEMFDTTKTAAIIGAGPSLDKSIAKIKMNANKYFIIATDTSLRILENAKIKPDCVVTLDGQALSCSHFIGSTLQIPFFVFDLCANNSLVKKLIAQSNCIIPVTSGHPLVNLYNNWRELNKYQQFITSLTAGNGTVLQLALDFAFNVGFTKFEFFGADFAFLQNKAYARGTYLEDNFLCSAEYLKSFENQNVNLMYKSELQKVDGGFTNSVLQSYKEFLKQYLKAIENQKTSYKICVIGYNKVNYDEFFAWFLQKIEQKDQNILFSLLPLAAWINKSKENSDIYKEALYFTRRHKR